MSEVTKDAIRKLLKGGLMTGQERLMLLEFLKEDHPTPEPTMPVSAVLEVIEELDRETRRHCAWSRKTGLRLAKKLLTEAVAKYRKDHGE